MGITGLYIILVQLQHPKCSAGSIDFKGQVHGSALHAYLSLIMYVSSMQAI